MDNFLLCIANAQKEGVADPDRAERARGLYEEYKKQFSLDLGDDEARAAAAKAAHEALAAEARLKKRRLLLTERAATRLEANLNAFRNNAGEEDFGEAILAVLENTTAQGTTTYPSVMSRFKAVRGRAHSRMAEAILTFKRTAIGQTPERARLDNLVREAFGEHTGDEAAKQLAGGWRDAHEFLRRRFNAAGGAIPARKDFGMPTGHDTVAVRRAGYDAWRGYIIDRIDPARMIDPITGKAPSPEGLEDGLRAAYDAISAEGWSKVAPSRRGGGKSVASGRAEHRWLVFKNADAWLEYQGVFGNRDPFDVMMGHVDQMSREVAAMEILGPNPASTLTWLKQVAAKRAAERAARGDVPRGKVTFSHVLPEYHRDWSARTAGATAAVDSMWANYMGTNQAPQNAGVAYAFGTVRNLSVAAQLGSATLAAVASDPFFARAARKMNGLKVSGALTDYLKFLKPGSKADQTLAIQSGLIGEEAAQVMSGQARYIGEIDGTRATRLLADRILYVSGLSPWTQAGKWAFGMEFLGALGRNLKTGWGKLDPDFRTALERYDFDELSWKSLQRVEPYTHGGARFLRPEDVATSRNLPAGEADELATRLLEMVQSETAFAVPDSTLRARGMLVAETRPGSIAGELTRSFAMYKQFPVTLMMMHMRRYVGEAVKSPKGLQNATELFIGLTLGGALAVQMREIAKGRDPRPMDNPDFWLSAAMAGGGLSVYGDFLYAASKPDGTGIATYIAGPPASFVGGVGKVVGSAFGEIEEAAGGGEHQTGRAFVDFLRKSTPGSSLWYTRLAMDRLLFDTLQKWADPDAADHFDNLESRYEERGQDFWWAPGEEGPERAPDLSAALP
jgi:hypothetical protein